MRRSSLRLLFSSSLPIQSGFGQIESISLFLNLQPNKNSLFYVSCHAMLPPRNVIMTILIRLSVKNLEKLLITSSRSYRFSPYELSV